MVGQAVLTAARTAVATVVSRFAMRVFVGMLAGGNAVEYQSVVVDATAPGTAVEVSATTVRIMDEVAEVPEGGMMPIDLIDDLPSKGTYPKRDPSVITTHYWHHSATDTLASFEALARGHLARGWPAIGYTGAIRSDGRFYVLHPLDRITNHTAGRNTSGVSTVLVGNFDRYDLPPKMYATALRVREYYRSKGVLKEAMHRDVKATACPGRFAVAKLRGAA